VCVNVPAIVAFRLFVHPEIRPAAGPKLLGCSLPALTVEDEAEEDSHRTVGVDSTMTFGQREGFAVLRSQAQLLVLE
jgi:hypothetical protein